MESQHNLAEISGVPRRVVPPEPTVTVTIGEYTATYATPAEAAVALLAAIPRNQRKVLWWMDALRRINQDEAGMVRSGNPESDVRAVAGVKG